MNECKKKLTSTVSKFDKINEMFSSAPIEKTLYETIKCEAVVRDSREYAHKISSNYDDSITRLKEIIDQGL